MCESLVTRISGLLVRIFSKDVEREREREREREKERVCVRVTSHPYIWITPPCLAQVKTRKISRERERERKRERKRVCVRVSPMKHIFGLLVLISLVRVLPSADADSCHTHERDTSH